MSLKRAFICALAVGAVVVAQQGCGARSGLEPCLRDSDCANVDLCATYACTYDTSIHNKACTLVQTTNCDDNNPCTADSCDKHTGACVNAWSTLDLDGDGHRGPLPGFQPGAAGSCGDDCDDTDPRAFPGNKEVCDGVDNDCDGIIDNGATYVPTLGSEFQLSKPGFDWAEPNSFVRGSPKGSVQIIAAYGASLAGQLSPFIQPLDGTGTPSEQPFVLTGSVAAGSDMSATWTGDRYGIAWDDRRDGNFEIYFALLDATGKKMSPGDERITVSDGFSLYPSVVWTGQEFIVAWQEEKGGGDFKLEGQRIGLDGSLQGNISVLTTGGSDDQGPSIAAGRTEVGMVWVRRDPTTQAQNIVFQPFDFNLTGVASSPAPLTITTPAIGGQGPSVAYDHKNDRYAVTFYDPAPSDRVVYSAIVRKDESIVTPVTNVSQSPAQTRDSAMIAFGDRVLFVYADDRDQNSGFELYAHELSADLTTELEPPVRITQAAGDSISPILTFAADGTVLVLFRDDRGPAPAVFETGLKCVMPP